MHTGRGAGGRRQASVALVTEGVLIDDFLSRKSRFFAFVPAEIEKVASSGNNFVGRTVTSIECDRLKAGAAGVIVVAVKLSRSTSTY